MMRVAPEHDAPVGPNRWPTGAFYMDHQREGRDEKCALAFRSLLLVAPPAGAGWLLPDFVENRPPIRAWASLGFGRHELRGAGPRVAGRSAVGLRDTLSGLSPSGGWGLVGPPGPLPGSRPGATNRKTLSFAHLLW